MVDHEELLQKTYALARENNRMLLKMRRSAFWGFIFRILLWALFLGVPLWLYFQFFEPVIGNFVNTYTQIQDTGNRASGQFEEFQNFLDRVPGFGGRGEPVE